MGHLITQTATLAPSIAMPLTTAKSPYKDSTDGERVPFLFPKSDNAVIYYIL